VNALPPAQRVPVATPALIGLVLLTAFVQNVWPAWLPALRRDPLAFAVGEWWRLPAALFAYDDGAVQISSILAGLAVLGIIGEPVFGPLRWLAIWCVAGLGGQAVGLAWQPVGAGSSVAVAGLLGAVATWALLPRTAMPLFARAGPALVFAGAAILCLLRDIHGPPVFVGAGLALVFLLGRRAQRTG
jgi:hypothetical protein